LREHETPDRDGWVQVRKYWVEGPDGFCIVWERADFDGKIGYYSQVPEVGGDFGVDHGGDPAHHGYDVASFVVLEPLGSVAARLHPDDFGISWITPPPVTG